MTQIFLRYIILVLIAAAAGMGGGYLAANNKIASLVSSSGTITATPAQPSPGQGVPAVPAVPAVPGMQSAGQGITVLTPNGGETFFSLENNDPNLITWRGNTYGGVKIALLRKDAAPNADPTPFIVGWIASMTNIENIYPWNDKVVLDGTFNYAKSLTMGGQYKILVAADDGKGNFTLWNKEKNKPAARFDISDNAFTIAPTPKLKVLYPNGGETVKIGKTISIRFEASDIPYNPWFSTMNVFLIKSTDNYSALANPRVLGQISVNPGNGTYTYEWDTSIGGTYETGDYYIVIDDASNGRGGLPDYDKSDAYFYLIAL